MEGICIPVFKRGMEKKAISPNVAEEIRANMIPFVLFIINIKKANKGMQYLLIPNSKLVLHDKNVIVKNYFIFLCRLRTRSLMDRIKDSGSFDVGSIPAGFTRWDWLPFLAVSLFIISLYLALSHRTVLMNSLILVV